MLAKANAIKTETRKSNVEFVESGITDMSVLKPGIADCIISNCVINLVPSGEKHLVFSEMFRLLKPGGRVAISDILAKKPLPEKLRSDIAMYVGCISGASEVLEYEKFFKDAGFGGKFPSFTPQEFMLWSAEEPEILIADTKSDLNVYLQTNEDGSKKAECCVPEKEERKEREKCCESSIKTCYEPKSSSCCATNCCADEKTPTCLAESDLNEWVGK